jgi:hypothetical protein
MKREYSVAIFFAFVLILGFCGADLGSDWNSFDGNNSGGSSVGVDVNIGSSGNGGTSSDLGGSGSRWVYTQDFYIALGVGAFGILILAVFLYFFFRRPRNKWERKAHK